MPSKLRPSLLLAVLLYGAGLTAARADVPAAPPANTPAAGPVIDGFRDAKFGMTESQVRAAIEAEFKKPAGAITRAENQLQHTAILNVQVPDLVPGGGTAAVSYVFGYQSHRLMEVNIVWSPEIDPHTSATTLYQNGETLQQYFAGEGFPADRSTGNIATPNGVLLFRATDTTGNAVVLILSGSITKDTKDNKTILAPSSLTLAYAADPLHPDVYQLAKGSF